MAEVFEITNKEIDFQNHKIILKLLDTKYKNFALKIGENQNENSFDSLYQYQVGEVLHEGIFKDIYRRQLILKDMLLRYITDINTFKGSKAYLSSISNLETLELLNFLDIAKFNDIASYELLQKIVTNELKLKQCQTDIQNKLHEIRTGILNYAGLLIFIRTDGLNYPTRTYIRPLFVSESLIDIYDIWNDGNVNQNYFRNGKVDVGLNYVIDSNPAPEYSVYDEYKKHLSTNVTVYIKNWSTFIDFSKTHYIVNEQTTKTINGINFKVTRVLRADIRDYSDGVEHYPKTYSEYLNGITNGHGRLVPVEFEDLVDTITKKLTLKLIKKFEL